MENASHNSTTLNETPQKTTSYSFPYFSYAALRYSWIAVIVFGIFGNTLVIISILRQRRLLRNNYYFLVFHLAICDLLWLLVHFFDCINIIFTECYLCDYSVITCLFLNISYVFQVAGIGMMLIISMLRYRATVHPLKPAISRRKLKVVCGLVYTAGLVAGYGPAMPLCFVHWNDVLIVYHKIHVAYLISCFYFFPPIFMAVVYYKICRALIKQNRYIKSVCSNPVRRSTPSSSLNILRFIRHRRTFLVCLGTVLCYGLGNIPISVWFIWNITGRAEGQVLSYAYTFEIGVILRLAGSHSVNPLIYGILDKRLLTFWKLCCKKKRRSQEN
jgi:hypothetical protein